MLSLCYGTTCCSPVCICRRTMSCRKLKVQNENSTPSKRWTQLLCLWSWKKYAWGAQNCHEFLRQIFWEKKVSWKLRHIGDEWHRRLGVRDAKVPFWVSDWRAIFLCSVYKAWEALWCMKHQICWANCWKVYSRQILQCSCMFCRGISVVCHKLFIQSVLPFYLFVFFW